MRMHTIVLSLALVCGCSSRVVEPAGKAGNGTMSAVGSVRDAEAIFTATLIASAACALVLEPEARERTYTVTLRSDGSIDWSRPTLNPPSGHSTISSGALADNALSFSIDVERDLQSDDFHGLWEDFGSGKFLNISGRGSGAVRGSEITGTFDGLFAVYDPLDPPQPGTLFTAHYCPAKDHQFRFVKQ